MLRAVPILLYCITSTVAVTVTCKQYKKMQKTKDTGAPLTAAYREVQCGRIYYHLCLILSCSIICFISIPYIIYQYHDLFFFSRGAFSPQKVLNNFPNMVHKGWSKKKLTDQILLSLYLKFRWSDLHNFGVYPP